MCVDGKRKVMVLDVMMMEMLGRVVWAWRRSVRQIGGRAREATGKEEEEDMRGWREMG